MENEKKKQRNDIISNVLVMFISALGIFILGAAIFEEATSTIKGVCILGLVVYIVIFQRSFNELCDINNNKNKETKLTEWLNKI